MSLDFGNFMEVHPNSPFWGDRQILSTAPEPGSFGFNMKDKFPNIRFRHFYKPFLCLLFIDRR
jgi:hypothetical protein